MMRNLFLILLLLALTACGFHLHSVGSLPPAMQRIQIEGLAENDPLMTALKTVLTRAGANVVHSAEGNDLIVHLGIEETKRSISLNRSGLSREFDLGYNLIYDIKTAKGDIVEPPQKLKINREQYNDQFLILGRQDEENLLRQEMRDEAAETLVRRMMFLLKTK